MRLLFMFLKINIVIFQRGTAELHPDNSLQGNSINFTPVSVFHMEENLINALFPAHMLFIL